MKALDFKFPDFSKKKTGEIINAIHNCIYPDKLDWDNLEYEWVDSERNIYTEKQKVYGMDSLYVFMNKQSIPYGVWQYRKLVDLNYMAQPGKKEYKTIAAIKSHAKHSEHPFRWLVIKNPKILKDTYKKHTEKMENPVLEKENYLRDSISRYRKQIKQSLKKINETTEDTIFEFDNFDAIARQIAKKYLLNPDGPSEWDMIKSYADNQGEEPPYGFQGMMESLVEAHRRYLKLKGYGDNERSRSKSGRNKLKEYISENKGVPFPKDNLPYDARYIDYRDKSGFRVDFTKYIVKRYEEFANSNDAIEEIMKDLETEFNELVMLAQEQIQTLITGDDWSLVKAWTDAVVSTRPDVNKLLQSEIPSIKEGASKWERDRFIEKITEQLADVRATKNRLTREAKN